MQLQLLHTLFRYAAAHGAAGDDRAVSPVSDDVPLFRQKLVGLAHRHHVDAALLGEGTDGRQPVACFNFAPGNGQHYLIAKLKEECPPLLYYTGNIGLANAESCAVLGSRNYLECDIGFAKQISERLINNEYIIATGGGSGIDREVERFTYKHNGCVIQYCAGDIMKSMHDPFYSEQLEKRSLLMLSTVTPRAEFSLEYARRRNKLIYANSKYAFLVNATSGRVTYTGAKEALEKQLCEVYCWNNPAYKGNLELIDFGAKPVNAVVRDSK